MFEMTGGKNVYTKRVSRAGHPLRSFKLIKARGKECTEGPYYSRTPMAAASKAFSRWCAKQRRKNNCATTVWVQETTKGSKKKVYGYNAERRVLRGSKKAHSQRNGVDVVYNYENKLYSVID